MEMTYTPASYHERVARWMSVEEASPFTFPTRTPEELQSRRITDIERLAVRLLNEATITHPVLLVWRARIVRDWAYAEYLPDPKAIPPEEWQQVVTGPQVSLEEIADALRKPELLVTYTPLGGVESLVYDPSVPPLERRLDEAARRLAFGIVEHRRMGEDGQELLWGLGPGIVVRTSLAAIVAEYHKSVLNVWHAHYQEQMRNLEGRGAT